MGNNKKWKCGCCGEKQSKDFPKFRMYDKKWNLLKGKSQCNECFKRNCI